MSRRHVPVLLVLVLACFTASGGTFSKSGPTSTNNDDTCDVGLFPAATLLLPYFEVDLTGAQGNGETTVFSVTNVTNREQIALVTVWTDYSYPVLSFNIYLTGYDVQSINLFDVIASGNVAPPRGTGTEVSPVGDFSASNPARNTASCGRLPSIPAAYVVRMQQALTIGRVPALLNLPACETVGSARADGHAVGYLTIDVVDRCTDLDPSQAAYYTQAIAFDNVLMGEYIQTNRGRNFAEGSPMVHIRAIPEGETAATRVAFPENFRSNVPQTFYGRFTGATKLDARQPLPSRFAARWIEGGPGEFETKVTAWREARTGLTATCADYRRNGLQEFTEVVVVDEEENAVGAEPQDSGTPMPPFSGPFPVRSAQRLGFGPDQLPEGFEEAIAGWVYLNLDDPDDSDSAPARQGWLTTSMRAEGRYSVNIDAIAMGNGCSPRTATTEIDPIGTGTAILGPSPNVNP
jgi:hypothetical protein